MSAGGAPNGVLRVGGIDYLNALPLTQYLPLHEDPPFALGYWPPSALADRLRTDLLEIALVPVVEYLARPDYRILPGICVSSYGPIQSIRLYLSKPVREARRVALDPKSRTSATLVRLLFRELWGASPEWVPLPRGAAELLSAPVGAPPAAALAAASDTRDIDAVLLIGDLALSLPGGPGWEVLDLGTEWTRWTGLPCVFAFWVARGEVASGPQGGRIAERFLRGKALGLARVDEIVARARLPAGLDAQAGRHYLSRAVRYDLGPAEVEGCLELYARLERAGLVSAAPRRLDFLSAEAACTLSPHRG